MKNLRAYIYMYVGIQLLLPTILVTAISWHLKKYYILGFYVIVLIVFSGYPCMPFKELCKKRRDTDIMRDFVYARKCGKVTVGKQYLYIMRGLRMHIIPAEDVAWVYGIDQTVAEYTGRGEKHIRKHLYASIHLKNRKAYKLSISRNNLNILIHELQVYPGIKLGY